VPTGREGIGEEYLGRPVTTLSPRGQKNEKFSARRM
jgi:hypothetical protein